MRLKELTYIEPGFSIEGLYFNYVNLIVGKNAVGKSRAVAIIKKFYQLITHKYDIRENDFFEYNVLFVDGDVDIRYRFVCQGGEVFLEYLDDSYSHYLDRQAGITHLYGENICPPKNKLCVNVRRDAQKYPEIEKIVRWAEQSYAFYFGTSELVCNEADCTLVSMFEKLGKTQHKKVIDMMKSMGYDIEDIRVGEAGTRHRYLLISEKDVLEIMRMEDLSQAMQKTLYIAVLMNYLTTKSVDSRTMIIDGLCEGIDCERSVLMGRYIYEFCIKNDIQLIATTNDTFLMNVVNLNYWNILKRMGGRVEALNMHNSLSLFSEFKSKNIENYHLLYD